MGSLIWQASLSPRHELIPATAATHQGFLRRNCKICAMNRAPALNFVSPRSMPSEGGGGREDGGRATEEEEQRRLGHLKAQVGGIGRYRHTLQTGRPNPWVLPQFKFVSSLLPSFTASLLACLRRSAGLTWLPDAFSLAVKLRT